MTRRAGRRAVLAVVGLGAVLLVGCGGGGAAVGQPPASRVLVVSLPGVAWSDVEGGDLPVVAEFTRSAAVGNLATRIGRVQPGTEAAYLTMGAGTRAVAPVESPAVTLEPGESYHGESAEDVLARRLGQEPAGLVYLAHGAARDANERSRYGAEVGMLGEELRVAGVHRAVIANADLREGRADDLAYGRSAAATLMDAGGQVPGGAVADRLLVRDSAVASGVRLDLDEVLAVFDREWAQERAVVVVEASDLSRSVSYGASASSFERGRLRSEAMASANALVAALLDRTGPDDVVLVVSPVAPSGAPHLGIAALRAPGADGGLLRSATTRRAGYVQLVDVAPTVLEVLGIEAPSEIEGRSFTVEATDGPPGGRISMLADAASAAGFRDDTLAFNVIGLVVALVLTTAAVVIRRRVATRADRPPPMNGLVTVGVRFVALWVLGVLPATFLAGPAGVADGPRASYHLFLLGAGFVLATVATVLDRWRPGLGPVVGVGALVVVIAGDVLVGAPLQMNSAFGYSVAVAGRFAGLGNLAFALLGSAAIVLAALLVERYGRRGLVAALTLLTVVVLVDGLPFLGGDVGGILSMVPAFGIAALALLGRSVGPRQVAAVVAVAVGALLASAFIDLARPVGSRTHLSRLADHIVDGRWEPFVDSLARRWTASFGSGELGAWVVLILLASVTAAYLVLVRTGRAGWGSLHWSARGPMAAAAVGLSVLGVLGLVANDSSFAVPFTMLLVVVPVLLHRAARTPIPLGAETW